MDFPTSKEEMIPNSTEF